MSATVHRNSIIRSSDSKPQYIVTLSFRGSDGQLQEHRHSIISRFKYQPQYIVTPSFCGSDGQPQYIVSPYMAVNSKLDWNDILAAIFEAK